MAITFVEKAKELLSEMFREVARDKSDDLMTSSYFCSAFPRLIAVYLKRNMMANKSTVSELDLGGIMKFTLTATKKGDSVALMPGFEMLEDGIKYINSDVVKFSVRDIELLADKIIKNKELINCGMNAFAFNVYSDISDEWEEGESTQGLHFDEESDISVAIMTIVATIIDVLANSKDSSADIEYTIDGLGKFTVKPAKNGYETKLVFDKEYKANCKSDMLAEKMSEIL